MEPKTGRRGSLTWHESTYLTPNIAYSVQVSSRLPNAINVVNTRCLAGPFALDGSADTNPPRQADRRECELPAASHPATVPPQEQHPVFAYSPAASCNTDSSKESDPGCRIGVPDGGLRAWLVVVGGFINFTIVFGLLNAFGTFQPLYEEQFPELGTSIITWVGSSQLFAFFFGGIVVGPLFDRYGSRRLMFGGTTCCVASFFGASASTEFWQLLLSQGVLFGAGAALMFYPATGAVSEWFNEKRALALGITVSGSSIGGIVWPILITRFYTFQTAAWFLRLVGIISAPLLLLSCWMIRERKSVAGHDTCGNQVPPAERSSLKALCQWRLWALSLSLLVLYSGVLIPFFYIPLYAKEHGLGLAFGNNLLAIAYAGSFMGRIGTGWLADHFGRFNILCLVGALVGSLTFSWIWMTSARGMIAFAVLFGVFSGGLVPLGSACVAQTTTDMGHIGLRIRAMMAICSLGALGGGPLSGLIKDASGAWVGVHCFSGSVSLLGSFLLMLVRFSWKPQLCARF